MWLNPLFDAHSRLYIWDKSQSNASRDDNYPEVDGDVDGSTNTQ